MFNKITRMPVSMSIMLIWMLVWILVVCNKNVLPALSGKGLAQIGKQYYRFFTAGLTHKSVIHLLFNVCGMFWVGYLYEAYMGSLKFLLVGLFCAAVCQIIFLSIYSQATESIGGSGYSFALCGFGLMMQILS